MNNEITAAETAAVAEQGATSAPETTKTTKKASPKKGAPKAKNGAKEPKKASKKRAKGAPKATSTREKPASKKAAKATKPAKAGVPREFSKKNAVLDLLRRKEGATLAEIAKATDWQNHSIRGFLSGQVSKRMGLTVESAKNERGERTYRLCGAPHNL